MNRNQTIAQLNALREETLIEQSTLISQIIGDCNHPELVSALLWRVTDTTVRYNNLTKALSKAVDNATKIPRWLGGSG